MSTMIFLELDVLHTKSISKCLFMFYIFIEFEILSCEISQTLPDFKNEIKAMA